jgi:hypothetical protein
MAASIRAHDVIPRTGRRIYKFTIKKEDFVDGVQITPEFLKGIGDWFMVLSLAKGFNFIELRPKDPHKSGVEARRYVGSVLKVPSAQLQARDFVVVKLAGARNLDIHVAVDTDSPALIEKARQLRTEAGRAGFVPGARVPFTIDVFAIDPETRAVLSSRVDAILSLEPMREMEQFDGFSAMDFGNTSTTLVHSRMNDDEFDVVQADVLGPIAESPSPVQTALCISAFRRAEKPEQFNAYKCVIGPKAIADREDEEWLVLGAKRLLADRRRSDASAGGVLVLGDAVHAIPSEDPAEVFISKMLQGFFYHQQSIPEPMVVTCPTTFTVSEVERLRRTVARAFHRATGKTASSFRTDLVDLRVPVVVDEASAAAFYFAYRDFITAPGRMPAFRYLYPHGMHMLLYDCGGGTTDLSLVRLEAPDDGHLKISVLGRAGHRTFGGDFVTEQFFKLLKMKLAIVKGFAEAPPAPRQLAEFLRKHDREINKLVPTTYDGRQMQNDEARKHAKTAMALWQLADKMKVRLGGSGVKSVIPGDSQVDAASAENEPLKTLDECIGFDYLNAAEQLRVERREIDALIDPEIERTIEYANDLVGNCMSRLANEQANEADRSPELPEVHWVYVVGNASRYPRILEKLLDEKQGLRVRFLKERLANVPPEDFKNSVAKGAVVAMKLQRMEMGLTVTWDQNLMKKLPYDIVHETLGRASDRILFEAGDMYSKRMHRILEVRPDPSTGRATTREIVLSRRWPGETRATKHIVFRFEEPISGPYVIEYDEETKGFVAYPNREGGAEERVAAEPFEPAPYVAPPQSGRI